MRSILKRRSILDPLQIPPAQRTGPGELLLTQNTTKPTRRKFDPKTTERLIDNILKREGLFNKGDPSMRGILRKTLEDSRRRRGIPIKPGDEMKELRALTEQEARLIYREDIIQPFNIAAIENIGLAELVFDSVVQHGSGRGVRQLQRSFNKVTGGNIDVDGVLGSRTAKAINEAVRQGLHGAICRQIKAERRRVILSSKDSTIQKQKQGLLDRINKFKCP